MNNGTVTPRGKFIRRIVLGIIVCIAAVFAAQIVWKFTGQTQMFRVKSIVIKNNYKVPASEVLALSGIERGTRMQECNVQASEKSIGSIPWVRKVRVVRQYPSTIRITLEERTPIAITASGTVHLVDNEGALIPFVPGTLVDMPVVVGLTIAPSGTRIDSADAVRLTSFLNDASQCASGLLQKLSQIDFSDKSLVRLKLANSSMLMELSSSEQRVGLMRLEKLLDIVSYSSQTQPQKLNVCYSNMAYAQW